MCPFIPVQNATMEDCVEIAREFAERLAIELGVSGKTQLTSAKIYTLRKYQVLVASTVKVYRKLSDIDYASFVSPMATRPYTGGSLCFITFG